METAIVDLVCGDGGEADDTDADCVLVLEASSSSSGERLPKRPLAPCFSSAFLAATPLRRRLSGTASEDDVEIVAERLAEGGTAAVTADEALARALADREQRAAERRQRRDARDGAMAREMACRWAREEALVQNTDAAVARTLQAEEGGAQGFCRCCEALCWAPADLAPRCQKQACVDRAGQFCEKLLNCGHPCCGVRGESACDVPCGQCGDGRGRTCGVCLDALSESPAIALACGHSMHMGCAVSMIENVDWRGRKICFAALRCVSGCGKLLDHPALASRMAPAVAALAFVERNVVQRAALDAGGRGSAAERLDLQALLGKYVYFQCFRCQQPYCGGLQECEVAGAMKEPAPESVQCPRCVLDAQGGACPAHGDEFMAIKCDYCCNEALFRCGTVMYCNPCHGNNVGGSPKPCDPSKCPLGGQHPKGMTSSWMMGCAACRGEAAEAARGGGEEG